ncbi:hypothetical protein T492DRAFT_987157 [Pavlovales sp. CCMP2436]|nr:hypothetical protein T492DRAFT_987157 [Pavlovales sp. CCMP2436]|mmetsp:Transcript_3149/g.7753  ORF Transcript_3149/g.7753 Transcript_3149/m.7753 type:complete len:337 (-) Transcript_3149:147-1157(-)
MRARLWSGATIVMLAFTGAASVQVRRADLNFSEPMQLDCGDVPDHGTQRRFVALCFYGINRSLRHTIGSIRAQIFAPLQRACVPWHLYMHTYSETTITSPHAGEFASRIGGSVEMIDLLRPFKSVVTSQADADASIDMRVYTRRGYAYINVTQLNLLRQLRSLQLVTALWLPDAERYGAIAYLRPDLMFAAPLDVVAMMGARDGEVYSPYWHMHLGSNDRFMFSRPPAAAVWGNRMLDAREYTRHNKLVSESFLAWVLAKHELQQRFTSMLAMRVRSSGEVHKLDACLATHCRWADNRCRYGCHEHISKRERKRVHKAQLAALDLLQAQGSAGVIK